MEQGGGDRSVIGDRDGGVGEEFSEGGARCEPSVEGDRHDTGVGTVVGVDYQELIFDCHEPVVGSGDDGRLFCVPVWVGDDELVSELVEQLDLLEGS